MSSWPTDPEWFDVRQQVVIAVLNKNASEGTNAVMATLAEHVARSAPAMSDAIKCTVRAAFAAVGIEVQP